MKLSRRHTLQLLSSLLASSAVPALAGTGTSNSKSEAEGYRALVCLHLYGGNDSWNLLVPLQNEIDEESKGKGYQTYQARRVDMAIHREALPLGTLISSVESNPYYSTSIEQAYRKGVYPIDQERWGIHGCAPELARLWEDSKLAWVANTGVLGSRLRREQLTPKNRPAFLFAHNHQRHALFTGDSSGERRYGWAGLLADAWKAGGLYGLSGNSLLGLNLAIGKQAPFMEGRDTISLVQPSGRPVAFAGMRNGNGRGQRYARDLTDLNQLYRRDVFGELFRDKFQSALELTHLLEHEWKHTRTFDSLSGVYGERLFEQPTEALVGLGAPLSSNLIRQFETVIRLIEIGQRLGLKRQIFSVYMGGFDTHSAQAKKHPLLIRDLSLSLWKFQQALQALGMDEQVTTFTQSDFGRTLQNNGDGTDHGWGGHQLVMGGAVETRIHGTMPDLREDSQDMFGDGRGRVIPSLAAEQTTAALTRWLGVSDELMPVLFPNLNQFQSSDSMDSSYLRLFRT